jgi:hypothetical protein
MGASCSQPAASPMAFNMSPQFAGLILGFSAAVGNPFVSAVALLTNHRVAGSAHSAIDRCDLQSNL